MNQAATLAESARVPSAPSRRDKRRRFLFVVWTAGVAAFRRNYAGTILGYTWIILQPLLLFAVLYAIFTEVIRFGRDIPHYEVMLLLNIVFFYFFREAGSTSMRSFVARKTIISSVRVPLLAVPLSTILAAAFVFAANLAVALVWAIVSDVHPQLGWLGIPALVAYMLVYVVSLGVLLACIYVRIRDVAQIWRPIVRLMFYVSGVIFPFALIPDGFFRTLAAMNPLSPLFVQLRVWIVDSSAPTWPESAGSTFATVLPFVVLAVTCIAAAAVYRLTRAAIAESL